MDKKTEKFLKWLVTIFEGIAALVLTYGYFSLPTNAPWIHLWPWITGIVIVWAIVIVSVLWALNIIKTKV
jgi:hypothetical protein